MIPTDDTCIAWIQFLFFILSLSDRRSGLRCTRTKMGIRDKLDGTGMGHRSLGLVSGRILVYSRLREFLRDGNGGLFLGLHACMMCERKNWEWMSDALTGEGPMDGCLMMACLYIFPKSTKGAEDGDGNEGVRYIYLIGVVLMTVAWWLVWRFRQQGVDWERGGDLCIYVK